MMGNPALKVPGNAGAVSASAGNAMLRRGERQPAPSYCSSCVRVRCARRIMTASELAFGTAVLTAAVSALATLLAYKNSRETSREQRKSLELQLGSNATWPQSNGSGWSAATCMWSCLSGCRTSRIHLRTARLSAGRSGNGTESCGPGRRLSVHHAFKN